jgi:glucans biosynthesis protein
MINRRNLVWASAGLAGVGRLLETSWAKASAPTDAFTHETVAIKAKALAAGAYRPPNRRLPDVLEHIDYGDYARLQFKADQALWRREGLPFQVQFFPCGYLYRDPVEIFELVDGAERPVRFDPALFANAGLGHIAMPADLGFSGFRLHHPINDPDYEEFAVFQGASYFRAAARNEVYGLSARGVSIGAGESREEFPRFTTFWLERPPPGAISVLVHALLDSESLAGAYSFRIQPGDDTVFDIEATLFPRREIAKAGLAPMSSMFFLGDMNRYRTGDLRTPIHDSQGLEIRTGQGLRLWRPLENPVELTTDTFADKMPGGFGLMQRRRPADRDSPQHYDRRPSLWAAPKGDWGQGQVRLVQIPTTDANADNITASWRPETPLRPGAPVQFSYRLTWGQGGPNEPSFAQVLASRRFGPEGRRFEIDYRSPPGQPPLDLTGLSPSLTSSAGRLTDIAIAPAPGMGSGTGMDGAPPPMRLSFELTDVLTPARLTAQLKRQDRAVSETWVYTWTK